MVLSGCNLAKTSGGSTSGNATESNPPSAESAAGTVTFNDSGVAPASLTVKSGEKVTWVNSSKTKVIVASDPHPAHTDNRELSNGQQGYPLESGQSVTVTLTKTGQWGFHDHLNPSTTGKVTVE